MASSEMVNEFDLKEMIEICLLMMRVRYGKRNKIVCIF